MKRITTSKGKRYDVDYAWAPLSDGSCMISMPDDRRLAEIADDFDGLTSIHYVNTDTGEYDWDGYTVLDSVSRLNGRVQIRLVRG